MRSLMCAIAFLTIPVWWALFNLIGIRITFNEIFTEWNENRKSGEHWGEFDK